MPTISIKYLGNLRTECTHIQSGTKIITDAPIDNQGKGEYFSPTDLTSTSLATCAMTIMGIYGEKHNVDLLGTTIEVTKIMAENPRRIGKIEIIFNMPKKNYSDKEKASIENAVKNCPVHKSLDPNVEQIFTFNW